MLKVLKFSYKFYTFWDTQFNICLAKFCRYGRCVYECDNDVCDSQMVNIMFEGGTIANLTMTAFSKEVMFIEAAWAGFL